jgi:hypothetical protein
VFVWRGIKETQTGTSLQLYGPAFFERLFRLVAQDMAHDHIRFTDGEGFPCADAMMKNFQFFNVGLSVTGREGVLNERPVDT